VRSIYLRSSGPKRTTRREGRVRDEKDEDERGIEGERERERERRKEPTVLEGIEREREREGGG